MSTMTALYLHSVLMFSFGLATGIVGTIAYQFSKSILFKKESQ